MKNYIKLSLLATLAMAGDSLSTPTTGDITQASDSLQSAVAQLQDALDSAASQINSSSIAAISNTFSNAAMSIISNFSNIGPKHNNIINANTFASQALKDIPNITSAGSDITKASDALKSAVQQLTYALDAAATATKQSSHTGGNSQADWLTITQAVASAFNALAQDIINNLIIIPQSITFAQKALKNINNAQQLLAK